MAKLALMCGNGKPRFWRKQSVLFRVHHQSIDSNWARKLSHLECFSGSWRCFRVSDWSVCDLLRKPKTSSIAFNGGASITTRRCVVKRSFVRLNSKRKKNQNKETRKELNAKKSWARWQHKQQWRWCACARMHDVQFYIQYMFVVFELNPAIDQNHASFQLNKHSQWLDWRLPHFDRASNWISILANGIARTLVRAVVFIFDFIFLSFRVDADKCVLCTLHDIIIIFLNV